MNNRPVEQALATLLPTHANDLPPQLVSLAVSLVAQSRSYSTSLKPEEEIARPYACAEIACRRLSRKLKLPPLLGHPPCPPRVYKKLFSFFDSSLTTSVSETKRSVNGSGSVPGTPSRAASGPSTPSKGSLARTPSKLLTGAPRGTQNTPTRSTPLKRTANGTPKPATSSQSLRKTAVQTSRPNGISHSTIIHDAPKWVMTNIRTVCKTLSTPAPRTSTWSRPPISRTLPPHIFAGVSSILYFISSIDEGDVDEETLEFLGPIKSTRDMEKDPDFKDLVDSLIVAVYFLVLARRRNPPPETQAQTSVGTDKSKPQEPKKLDKKTFAEMRQTALVSLGLPPTEKKHREDVDQWIALIMELNWANGQEWFENVPMAGEMDGENADLAEDGLYDPDEDGSGGMPRPRTIGSGSSLFSKNVSRGGLLPGLGTMMQDRVDWLSEERREDYMDWKTEIMERIARMERAGA